MIASLRGHVLAVAADTAVVEVGGVGMAVHCTPSTLATLRPGMEVRLATSLVVREDSLTLYGFADDDAKQLFELLQTASGVGPRLAQAVLAVHAPDVVRKAIGNADLSTLTQVPGIGRKGAERLVLELRDKVGAVALVDGSMVARPNQAWSEQVRQALIGLGWSATQADQAVATVAQTATDEPVAVLLKQAIRLLGRNR
jgi:Holliday junction DNA helicase RuvA